MTSFFEKHPRFYETTGTLLKRNRFSQRYRAIIERHRHLFEGARVLDLASHDGRWSMAAIDAGAVFVEGVEGRQELVDRASENFAYYGVAPARFQFVCDDVVRFLRSVEPGKFDLILCLGFFYHTMHHMEILERIGASRAPDLIIDTGISPSAEAVIAVSAEDVGDVRNAIGDPAFSRMAVVGAPSRAALSMMLAYVGYRVDEISWDQIASDWAECEDYRLGRRSTFRASRADQPLLP